MKRLTILLGVSLLAGCGGTATTSSSAPSSTAASASPAPAGSVPARASNGASPAQEQAVAAENNPPGDIPDNIAFVPYTNDAGRYTFTHPEGWAEKTGADTVNFTDKLNGVQASTGTATGPPTVATARRDDLPALASSQAAFELQGITAVSVPAGKGVRIVYRRNSAPDAVTGRQYRDEVERYELVTNGRELIVELYGPVGADNVDAYREMIQSLRFS